MNRFPIVASLLLLGGAVTAHAEVKFPGKPPGKANVECSDASATLSNKMFSASFRKAGKGVGKYGGGDRTV